MRKWNTFGLFVLLLTVLPACNQAQNTEQATKNAPVTAKAETDAEEVEEVIKEAVPEAATDALIVSTTAELISSITPDAHIILKSGTYNFSVLTEAEIAGAGAYVDPDLLKQGEFFVYNAPGLILEAEKSGSVRLVTENGYADVMTLSYCDGAVLKGLVLGHEVEKGECDANVLKLLTSQSVTVENCSLFGCGTYGIYGEDAAVLTVIGTEIYECTNGILNLSETSHTVFEHCNFHDNDGMFFLWGGTQIQIRNTEISQNQGSLLQAYNSQLFDADSIHITFQNCTFRGNRDMGIPKDWSCATFEACDFSSGSTPVLAGMTYEDLVRRYRDLAMDPDAFQDADGAGEQNFLMIAGEMAADLGEDPADIMGYAIQDLNGDGVPELAIGFTPEYGAYLSSLFTLAEGTPRLVFGEAGDGYTYLQDGSFFYNGCRSASENGKGIYQFTDDGTALICREFYFLRILDGDESDAAVYYNSTGSWEIGDSRKTNMTVEEFWAWEPEYMYLPMTPFSAAD